VIEREEELRDQGFEASLERGEHRGGPGKPIGAQRLR
jgi:hypothetical protein